MDPRKEGNIKLYLVLGLWTLVSVYFLCLHDLSRKFNPQHKAGRSCKTDDATTAYSSASDKTNMEYGDA